MEAQPAPPARRRRTAVDQGRPLRAHVQMSIVGVTALAVVLFAVPLAIAVRNMYSNAEVSALQSDATQVAAAIPEDITSHGITVSVPWDLRSGLTIGVYSDRGTLIREHGPLTSLVAAQASDGRGHVAVEGDQLVVSAPVPADKGIAATVRVAVPNEIVIDRTLRAWVVMALLGIGVVGIAAVLARRQASRIAQPLELLTESARALGDGDFTISTERSHIREADMLSEAIESTAGRLGELVGRERAFSTHVSHQLRTPLTALMLGLESALSRPDTDLRAAAEVAVQRGQQLEDTIENVLRLTREMRPVRRPLDVPALLNGVRDHWQSVFAERQRQFVVRSLADVPSVPASATAVRHVIDVLVDNALVHGAGCVAVTASTLAGGLLVEVSDEGGGLADPDSAFAPRPGRTDTHGIGLALARRLAEAEGGRLLLRHVAPHPVFGLLLPSAQAEG